jgi:hypothetical protein
VLARESRKVEKNMSEDRIARIEADVGHVKTDVADLKVKLDSTNERMDKMNEGLIQRMDKMYERLSEKIDKLRDALWMTRIEMLLIGAGLLAIIARVFKWV